MTKQETFGLNRWIALDKILEPIIHFARACVVWSVNPCLIVEFHCVSFLARIVKNGARATANPSPKYLKCVLTYIVVRGATEQCVLLRNWLSIEGEFKRSFPHIHAHSHTHLTWSWSYLWVKHRPVGMCVLIAYCTSFSHHLPRFGGAL